MPRCPHPRRRSAPRFHIDDDVQRARDAQVIQAATNDFLRAIPHQVPRGGMAALRLDSMEIIRQKTDLVSTLEQILKRLQLDRAAPKQAVSEAPGDVLRRQYASLKCDLTPVRRDSAAYEAIAGYLRRGWPECTLEAIFERRSRAKQASRRTRSRTYIYGTEAPCRTGRAS